MPPLLRPQEALLHGLGSKQRNCQVSDVMGKTALNAACWPVSHLCWKEGVWTQTKELCPQPPGPVSKLPPWKPAHKCHVVATVKSGCPSWSRHTLSETDFVKGGTSPTYQSSLGFLEIARTNLGQVR